MLKLFGSAFIIIGCGGVAYSGILGCRTRIELLTALERLLQKGIYILLGQQQNTIIFLKNVSCGNKELEGELFRMGRRWKSICIQMGIWHGEKVLQAFCKIMVFAMRTWKL